MTQKTRNNLLLGAVFFGIVVATLFQRKSAQEETEVSLAGISVIGQGKPVLLELGSDRCLPCQEMKPVLVELAGDYPEHFTVAFHDVWNDPSVGEKYGISVIPTQIFLDKDGKELFRHEGFFSTGEILAKWKELEVEIP